MKSLSKCDVLLVGSSVAQGTGSTGPMWNPWQNPDGVGYAELLQETLSTRLGLSFCNAAVGGDNTVRCLKMLCLALPICRPRWVIVGLSMGNEGLPWARTAADAERQADSYIAGVRQIAATAVAAGARVIVGGVYPHGKYKPHHLHALRRADTEVRQGGLEVVDFLSSLDSGSGRWRDGTEADFAHPNAQGHQHMFEAFSARLPQLFSEASDAGSTDRETSVSIGSAANAHSGELHEQANLRKPKPKPKPRPRQQTEMAPLLPSHEEGKSYGARKYDR